MAAKLVHWENIAAIYSALISVLGCFHAFIKVGTDAKASLNIANIIAIMGSFVMYQSTNANADKPPHI